MKLPYYNFTATIKEGVIDARAPGSVNYMNATSTRASWSVSDATTQSSGGVPGYPFEALAIGVIIALFVYSVKRLRILVRIEV